MRSKKKWVYPLVEIKWRDAMTSHGWDAPSEAFLEIPVVTTVGFLIDENEHGVLVASTVAEDKQCNARILIPAENIISKETV